MNTKKPKIWYKAIDQHGRFVCFLTEKKSRFYISNNLGKRVDSNDNIPVMMFLFELNGPGLGLDNFSSELNQNMCVVCGNKNELTTHHVVPKQYRMHILSKLNNIADRYKHDPHDLVILCINCHDKYENKYSFHLKQKIADEYNAPIDGSWEHPTKKHYECSKNARLFKLAKTLLKYHKTIPQTIKTKLLQEVQKNINFSLSLDVKKFQQDWDMKYQEERKKYYAKHGELVVYYLKNYHDIETFIIMWRKHFITSMNPKYLSKFWNVNRKINTLNEIEKFATKLT